MSEEMKQALQQFAQRLLQEGNNAIAFGKEQAPTLVQEFLNWTLLGSLIYVLLGSAALYGLFRVACWGYGAWEASDGDGILPGLFTVGSGLSMLILSLFVMDRAALVVKVLVAPRLVVLEFVRGLL